MALCLAGFLFSAMAEAALAHNRRLRRRDREVLNTGVFWLCRQPHRLGQMAIWIALVSALLAARRDST